MKTCFQNSLSLFEETKYETFTNPGDIQQARRLRYEPLIFNILKERFQAPLTEYWNSCEIPTDSNKAFVLVERRVHHNLLFILKNISYFGRGWAIYLFCSKQNYPYIQHILDSKAKSIHIAIAFSENAGFEDGKRDYNELLKTREFWGSINAEHVCTVEMDSYLRRPIPESILAFDYLACPWSWMPHLPGGGGLSFRRRSAMLRICEEFRLDRSVTQDVYAANGCLALGMKYAKYEVACQHLVENHFTPNPVGLHQWWTFIGDYLGYNAALGGKQRFPPPDVEFLRELEFVVDNYLRFELD